MKRRHFLGAAAFAAAALPSASPARAWLGLQPPALSPEARYRRLVPELFEPVPRPPAYTPVIVIGSGFGGSIAAYRLSQAGIPTTVLERGCRWPIDPWRPIHSADVYPDGRAYWQRTQITHFSKVTYYFDKFNGVLDATDYDNIQVWRGACVGGGSKVFTGVMIQPPRPYFETIFGDVVDYEEMNAIYYPRVREMLRLDPMPGDIYRNPSFGHSRIWDHQVGQAGYTPKAVDGIWNWDVVRAEIADQSRDSATVGESNHGNANGAKFDLTQNYLKWAEESGYTEVYPGRQVRSISQQGDQGRYRVRVAQMDPMGEVFDEFELTCDYLVMAAGSIGTTELLLKARELGELRNLNEHIGEGWGTNGDTAVGRLLDVDRYPAHLASMLDVGDFLDGATQGSPCASKILDTPLGLPTCFESWYATHFPGETTIIGTLGMVMDMTHRARFAYDRTTDKVALLWPEGGNADAIAASRELNERISEASGATAGNVNGSFTAHPLGGAILGRATDAYGRLEGHPRLYVMDGAMINGSTGTVNPSLTISALAERNMEHLLKTDFRNWKG